MSEWTMRDYTYIYELVSYKVEQEGDITDIVTEVNFNVTATDTSSNAVTFPWRFTFCKYSWGTIIYSRKIQSVSQAPTILFKGKGRYDE